MLLLLGSPVMDSGLGGLVQGFLWMDSLGLPAAGALVSLPFCLVCFGIRLTFSFELIALIG